MPSYWSYIIRERKKKKKKKDIMITIIKSHPVSHEFLKGLKALEKMASPDFFRTVFEEDHMEIWNSYKNSRNALDFIKKLPKDQRINLLQTLYEH